MSKKLQVVAKKDGFRRAGFVFGSEATILKTDDLTEEQITALKEEPNLVVVEFSGDKPDTKKAADEVEARANAAEAKIEKITSDLNEAHSRVKAAESEKAEADKKLLSVEAKLVTVEKALAEAEKQLKAAAKK